MKKKRLLVIKKDIFVHFIQSSSSMMYMYLNAKFSNWQSKANEITIKQSEKIDRRTPTQKDSDTQI